MSNGDLLDKELAQETQQGDNADKLVRQAENEALIAEATRRRTEAELATQKAVAEMEILSGDRLASDEVKALAEELAELQLKLDKDRVAVDDKEIALEEAYALKVYQVDAGVDERIKAGINNGMKDERVITAKVIKVYKEMYEQGVHWCNSLAYVVEAQGSYSDRSEEAQEDIASKGKAMMEAGGFSSVLSKQFGFKEQVINRRLSDGKGGK